MQQIVGTNLLHQPSHWDFWWAFAGKLVISQVAASVAASWNILLRYLKQLHCRAVSNLTDTFAPGRRLRKSWYQGTWAMICIKLLLATLNWGKTSLWMWRLITSVPLNLSREIMNWRVICDYFIPVNILLHVTLMVHCIMHDFCLLIIVSYNPSEFSFQANV